MERRGASECVDGGPRGLRVDGLDEMVQDGGRVGAGGGRVLRDARDNPGGRLSTGEQDARRERRGVSSSTGVVSG